MKRSNPLNEPDVGQDDGGHDVSEQSPLMSHREIASRLGLGRASVFYLEKRALAKLKQALSRPRQTEVPVATRQAMDSDAPQGIATRAAVNPAHGWLRASRIISLNEGSVAATDIAAAFTQLKLRHPSAVNPGVLVRSGRRTAEPYTVQAAMSVEDEIWLRCWPNASASRNVSALADL